ncbi:phage recombination protein Bet [Lysinibacillus sp. UGB7]|uniref:phage recombination protein Bet n=1 Tax=Lysinibacillus sp. UGB7 TaxID=3411039 RepID=UPI003B8279A3
MYATKLADSKINDNDANAFFEVCEVYGLNPLQGDILIQSYETKQGRKVSYIVTRDGLLKHAHRQKDFVSMNAGVVHQNDHFEFDVANEVIQHKFSADRGQIIGAWAVLKTKTRGNVMEFVNYMEYKTALGSKNDLWNKMPSSMIKKVAQSNAIRSAFPLGVNFRSEDEFNEYEEPGSEQKEQDQPDSLKDELQAAALQDTSSKQPKKGNSKSSKVDSEKNTSDELKDETNKISSEANVIEPQQLVTSVSEKEVANDAIQSESKNVAAVETNTNPIEQTKINSTVIDGDVDGEDVYTFVKSDLSLSPTNKQKFLKVYAYMRGTDEMLFAAEENIELFDEFENGVKFSAQVESHQGFKFVKSVKVLAAA